MHTINQEQVQSGQARIEWARAHMPILAGIRQRFAQEQPLKGFKIGICLHVEAKTGVWLDALTAGGAEIVITGSPGSTQDDVAAALNQHAAIRVLGCRADTREDHDAHCRQVLRSKPNIIADNGADLLSMVYQEPEFAALSGTICGSTEETTTGAFRLRENNVSFNFATWVINDTQAKQIVENRYGVGSSVVDGLMRATNIMLHGKVAVVIGYGYCGSGIAQRLRGMGAHVVVVETDPMRRLEAHLEGFRTSALDDCLASAQLLITVTGRDNVLTLASMKQLKDGCILANAGHFSSEIDLEALAGAATSIHALRPFVKEYQLENGPRIFLIADGNLVNLSAGDGNPIEIMDLGLALQSLSLEQMALKGRGLASGVHPVALDIERGVAALALQAWA